MLLTPTSKVQERAVNVAGEAGTGASESMGVRQFSLCKMACQAWHKNLIILHIFTFGNTKISIFVDLDNTTVFD